MNKKQRFLDYLKKFSATRFVPARELAETLEVTDRTIRNYVKELNQKEPGLITANRNGYKYTPQKMQASQLKLSDQSIDSRRFYILRRMFKSAQRGVDVFDLADALYVSDASIRADLAALSKLAEKYDLVVKQRNGRYLLLGEDRNKRRLMIQLIRSVNPDGAGFEADIQKFLETISLKKLIKVIKAAFETYGLKPNSYFLKNFVLHLAIAMDRARGMESETVDVGPLSEDPHVSEVICYLKEQIAQQFAIDLLMEDVQELNILCEGEFRHETFDLSTFVEPKVLASLNKALAEISSIYLIDFSEGQFKNRLLLHVQSLYQRSKKQKFSRNLSLLEIRVKYPVLFDIAIYLSSVLANDLSITISDDEIAFLALHIGAFVDSQKKAEQKIRTVIVTPSYHSSEQRIQASIEKEFGDELTLVAVVEDLLEVDIALAPELILSTHKFLAKESLAAVKVPQIFIKEFLTPQDFHHIRAGIIAIKQKKYRQFLEEYLPVLIREEFYLELTEPTNKEAVFDLISAGFQAQGYVPFDFKQQLAARETMSATSFPSGIAIPHTIKYAAYRTGLFVIHSQLPIDWSGIDVHFIIALAVDKDDSEDFNRIFTRMVELLAETVNISYLKQSTNRLDFISRMIELMLADGYYDE
ncbi:BglG family transcription antiterminator [Enterococcus faecalis]